jgi:hypothetical protein
MIWACDFSVSATLPQVPRTGKMNVSRRFSRNRKSKHFGFCMNNLSALAAYLLSGNCRGHWDTNPHALAMSFCTACSAKGFCSGELGNWSSRNRKGDLREKVTF